MSHIALQRVMVRMLYDPRFASRVLRDPENELPGEGLTAEERGWLLRPDPRAWRTDPERPLRSLTALLQEYPASAALAVTSGGGADAILRFFASPAFHRVIQERGSMALAFGDYLAEMVATGEARDGRVAPLAVLEQAIAGLRRRSWSDRSRATEGTSRLRLSADKAILRARAGTADLHDQVRLALARTERDLPQAVLEGRADLPATPVHSHETEPLLLELVPGEGPRVKAAVGVAEITPEFYAILDFALSPRTPADLEAEAVRLGAEPDDAADLVLDLVEQGVLASG